jgi:hypothetical protein
MEGLMLGCTEFIWLISLLGKERKKGKKKKERKKERKKRKEKKRKKKARQPNFKSIHISSHHCVSTKLIKRASSQKLA